ncbi:MAG: hypothetical protein LBK77_01140, partial [Spirochaetaceae bacterium]|nr:hypothetical protein [Spirochaetaceae bacterium]
MKKFDILKRFLVPVFERHGYEEKKLNLDRLRFQFKENESICVDFDFIHMHFDLLETTIKHPRIEDCVKFPEVIDGPTEVCWNGGAWMGFDTTNDLIGLLEFQMSCFEKWIFDLLAGKSYDYVFAILRQQREEITNKNMSRDELFKYSDTMRERADEICARRYKPIVWNFETKQRDR